jgi:phospholipase C
VQAGFAVPPNYGNLGGPVDGAEVIPPFRVNSPASPALTYLPGTNHSWGQYDSWPVTNGPMVMSYMIRADLPYHYALADAFRVGDAYHHSIMGPTSPNRMYPWTGCFGNVSYLDTGGTDGLGAGPPPTTGLVSTMRTGFSTHSPKFTGREARIRNSRWIGLLRCGHCGRKQVLQAAGVS